MTSQQASDRVILEHASHLYRQIERLLAGELPEAEDQMAYALACYLKENGVTCAQLIRLREAVIHRKWEAIPVLHFRTLIAAQLEADFNRRGSPKTYDVNDNFDVARVAAALDAADILITDKAMVAAINAGAHRFSHTRIFALHQMGDAAEFIEETLARTEAPGHTSN